jgi:hypothetical protein
MLITEGYREQQQALHANLQYGTASLQYAPAVQALLEERGITDLLDYGAGKGRLGEALFVHGYRGDYHPFDPAIPYWSDAPEPAEMVACIDVLEHVEPDLLDEVLDDLQRLTRTVGVFTVHTGPAKKVLPDGRNAHLIQQPAPWWRRKLSKRFRVLREDGVTNGALFVVEPLS